MDVKYGHRYGLGHKVTILPELDEDELKEIVPIICRVMSNKNANLKIIVTVTIDAPPLKYSGSRFLESLKVSFPGFISGHYFTSHDQWEPVITDSSSNRYNQIKLEFNIPSSIALNRVVEQKRKNQEGKNKEKKRAGRAEN